ncbi:non-anchored cell wall -6 [Trichoderma cornu-damae]|uniref:Non-anchored cell wall -6 n=1 Tax=Trichoderma cornu-damae TaxID=654480 RepID=A0A9P8QEK5_9HYPO|nr:non-anchored cell wall -6 [Trichoderma cornu-damae]
MPKNALLGTAGLTLLSTSILFIWFIILPGVTSSTPFSKTYYLRADTSGITGARDISQWTYFFICGLNNEDCGDAHPAIPFGSAWDSNAQNVPPGLGGSHGSHTTSFHYFFMWRFGWVFLLMTLFFEVMAFFTAFVSCCGRLGAALAFVVSGIALFFYSLAVALITATFVEARNRFHDVGRSAQIGAYAFGFLWGSYAALLIAVILFGLGIRTNAKFHLGRRRSSRGSRGRSYDGRRVKDDYS